MGELDLDKYIKNLERRILVKDIGKVTDVVGNLIEGYLPGAKLGSVCEIAAVGRPPIITEVIGFQDKKVLMMPLTELSSIGFGSRIELVRTTASIKVGPHILGRVINGLGEPIDNKRPMPVSDEVQIYRDSSNPMDRVPIREPLDLGIKAINSFLTVGKGQRVGVMAGSGVGKSVLMGMIARSTQSDVNVIALIGERGREVREFVEYALGEEGLKKSVVVAVTSDQSPLIRMRGAFIATAIAEYFSAQGKDVLLMMDSLTRFAMAQREIGLNAGEPVTTKGYTPSVFSLMPKLLERAGQFEKSGSITGLYTVLVEGDDMDDPIADSVRSIVDGHIVLDRSLAQKGHFPAIDILQSASRVMPNIIGDEHKAMAQVARAQLAIYKENEDLIRIGAYQPGQSEELDRAIAFYKPLERFLKQEVDETWGLGQSVNELKSAFLKNEEI
ncbi:MAG: FliI/YscN family ATPase [Bdellovibrionales bacterium]|nr:FliI/YscN family ATPase [Bdellovibrionales bacterium]